MADLRYDANGKPYYAASVQGTYEGPGDFDPFIPGAGNPFQNQFQPITGYGEGSPNISDPPPAGGIPWWQKLLPWLKTVAGVASGVGRVAAAGSDARAQARADEAQLAAMQNRNAIDLYGIQDRGAVDRYGLEDRGAMDRARLEESGSVDRYGIQQRSILDAMGLGENATMARAALDLEQRKFQLGAPQVRGKTALMGDMFARATDMTLTPPPGVTMPKISGGYTWNSMSPEMRQMGQVMLSQALAQQLLGDEPQAPPMQNFMGGVMTPPAQTALPPMTPMPTTTAPNMAAMPGGPNGLDSFLKVLGILGGTAGAIDQYTQRSPTVRT